MALKSNRLPSFVFVLAFARLLFFASGPSHFRVGVLLPFFNSTIIFRLQDICLDTVPISQRLGMGRKGTRTRRPGRA